MDLKELIKSIHTPIFFDEIKGKNVQFIDNIPAEVITIELKDDFNVHLIFLFLHQVIHLELEAMQPRTFFQKLFKRPTKPYKGEDLANYLCSLTPKGNIEKIFKALYYSYWDIAEALKNEHHITTLLVSYDMNKDNAPLILGLATQDGWLEYCQVSKICSEYELLQASITPAKTFQHGCRYRDYLQKHLTTLFMVVENKLMFRATVPPVTSKTKKESTQKAPKEEIPTEVKEEETNGTSTDQPAN